jgi:hypothetical protein
MYHLAGFGCLPKFVAGTTGDSLEFLPSEFSRDVVQQTDKHQTTQEVIGSYLSVPGSMIKDFRF